MFVMQFWSTSIMHISPETEVPEVSDSTGHCFINTQVMQDELYNLATQN